MLSLRSLPNMLGLFRILTTPLLVWLIWRGTPSDCLWAVALLLAMAISDVIDGPIARRLQVVSPLGVFLDTISDKIFVTGALIPMVEVGILPGWAALTIIVRDFVVSGLRSFAAAEGIVISAGKWGKQKLVITVTALVWALLATSAQRGGWIGTVAGGVLMPLLNLWLLPMGLALVWTVGSAFDYLRQAWPLLLGHWTPKSTDDE